MAETLAIAALSFFLLNLISERMELSGSVQQTPIGPTETSFDVEQTSFGPTGTSFDVKQTPFGPTETSFDVEQTSFGPTRTSFDVKQDCRDRENDDPQNSLERKQPSSGDSLESMAARMVRQYKMDNVDMLRNIQPTLPKVTIRYLTEVEEKELSIYIAQRDELEKKRRETTNKKSRELISKDLRRLEQPPYQIVIIDSIPFRIV